MILTRVYFFLGVACFQYFTEACAFVNWLLVCLDPQFFPSKTENKLSLQLSSFKAQLAFHKAHAHAFDMAPSFVAANG